MHARARGRRPLEIARIRRQVSSTSHSIACEWPTRARAPQQAVDSARARAPESRRPNTFRPLRIMCALFKAASGPRERRRRRCSGHKLTSRGGFWASRVLIAPLLRRARRWRWPCWRVCGRLRHYHMYNARNADCQATRARARKPQLAQIFSAVRAAHFRSVRLIRAPLGCEAGRRRVANSKQQQQQQPLRGAIIYCAALRARRHTVSCLAAGNVDKQTLAATARALYAPVWVIRARTSFRVLARQQQQQQHGALCSAQEARPSMDERRRQAAKQCACTTLCGTLFTERAALRVPHRAIYTPIGRVSVTLAHDARQRERASERAGVQVTTRARGRDNYQVS